MKSVGTYVLILAALSVLSGCRGDGLTKALRQLDTKELYGNSQANWRLFQTVENNSDVEYIAQKVDGDTLKVISIYARADDAPVVGEYYERFPNGLDTCMLSMERDDTLFFYCERQGAKTFFVGEYAYRYLHMKLSPAELEFYQSNADSLRKVRGDGLPSLIRVGPIINK